MLKIDCNDVEIQIEDNNVDKMIEEFILLAHTVFWNLKENYSVEKKDFKKILNEITDENNFFIESCGHIVERCVSKCDL